MDLLSDLSEIWRGREEPFFVQGTEELCFRDLAAEGEMELLGEIQPGEVVALVGDFDPPSMALLLRLIEKRVILVPLTADTREQHEYFFESAGVEWVLEAGELRRVAERSEHTALQTLRECGHAGLVLFTTGTTGRPKAILHDFEPFLRRFRTPRPALRALSFLRFDHIGGLNTLLHVLYNRGLVVAPQSRSVEGILEACRLHAVEVLPTTPTFLRMLLLSGLVPEAVPASLRVITYGTERMDEPTLAELCRLLPEVDFRQTYGMSELGILRVKSEARDSLFMKVGGEGVETRVEDGTLRIRAANRMMGYLNEDSPFDADGTGRCHQCGRAEGAASGDRELCPPVSGCGAGRDQG
jgi:non-ribosomal peptide synthetase component F